MRASRLRLTSEWSRGWWLPGVRDEHQWDGRESCDGDQDKKNDADCGDEAAVGVAAHDFLVSGGFEDGVVGEWQHHHAKHDGEIYELQWREHHSRDHKRDG